MTTPPTADSPTPKRHREPAGADHDAARLLRKLTPREAQTLAHLAAGHDLPRTAAALGITPTTARSYLLRAMRKLGAPTEAEAITRAAGTLPYVPPLRPANFAGLTPSSLGPAAVNGRTAIDGGRTRTAEQAAQPAPQAVVAAPPGATPPPASGARRGRTARRARQECGDTAHAPARGRPSSRPDQAPRPDLIDTSPETGAEPHTSAGTGTARTAAPTAAAHGRPAADGGQAAPAASAADEERRQSSGTGRNEEAAQHDNLAQNPQGSTAPEHQRPPLASRTAPSGDGPQAPQDSSTAKHQQPPAVGGGPAPAPAGTEGHGEMTHTAPAAPAAGGRGRPAERRDPSSPAPASPYAADRPAPSFEELYESTHTRLVQQVFLLTACRHRAVHCVRLAFGQARRGWRAVARSGDPEAWVRVRAFELALSPWHRGGPRRAHAWGLPHRRIKVRPADESQAVLPDHDRLTDRDRALLKALKRLSRPQRRALVLHDGLGLPAAAIAVEVESTRAAAEGRVWTARAALAQWVPDLVGPDPAAPGFADGLSRLMHRAAVRGCPAPHRAPVPVLRARYRLGTASRTGAAALLTAAVGGAALATLSGVRPAVLFRPPEPPAPSLCLPAAEAEEPGVPLLPGGAPNGISSLWCSPAPGLEAVVLEPHSQAVARWQLPEAARGAEAPPPQGPVVCPLWSPRPCTTGPRAH
ncbi:MULTISPECIES: LuxR C-terminal-related transcriptional regulator [unclassified Kitasatospora]|uniref:LuxR C-terminal-related transcriptional regulator n=1 Tax=unclassified Kitasatospora TaxID=2633591 RepID=UPI0033CD84F8